MEVIFPSCAGIDVHQKFVVACRMYKGPDGVQRDEKQTFSTMTNGLLKLNDWLVEANITHAAMESTGDYWKSVYNILDGVVEVWVVNASHVKNVPGHKTDVKDATWLCDLMRHGLLRPSFIPCQEQREWRDLNRMRVNLVRERASACNRMHKALESCNIKLGAVATDLLGTSCRLMLNELAKKPDATPEAIANMPGNKLRANKDLLVEALQGRMNDHHRFMIDQLLEHVTDLDRRIAAFDKRIEDLNAPFKSAVDVIDPVPGISTTAAYAIISEIGTDMNQFPSLENICSWAAVCPGNNESGGKRFSGRIRKGNRSLRVILVQAAHVAARMPGTQFYALYRRIAARRGKKRAIIAVAHAILAAIYSCLKSGKPYVEPGPDYVKPQNPERQLKRLQHIANKLGFEVIDPKAAVAA